MHELGVLNEVLKQVSAVMDEQKLTKVDTIVLEVGQLSTILPKYLNEFWQTAISDTPFSETKLRIEEIPAEALCHICSKTFDPVKSLGKCPVCNKMDYNFTHGKEFFIKEIVAI